MAPRPWPGKGYTRVAPTMPATTEAAVTIHNTTSAVTLTRAECEQAANVLRGLATAAGVECPELESAAEALQGLLDGFTHLVLREKDDA